MASIDRLFRVYEEIELPGGVQARVRAMSDYELQLRSKRSLEVSSKAVRELRNPDSGEHFSLIAPLDEATDESLRAICGSYHVRDANQQAARDLQPKYIPFPDDASDEEKRKVIEDREKELSDIRDKRIKKAGELLDAYRKSLESKDRDRLLAEAKRKIEGATADSAYADEYANQTLLICVETPDGKPYFDGVDEVRLVPSRVQDMILEKVRSVNEIDPLRLGGQ